MLIETSPDLPADVAKLDFLVGKRLVKAGDALRALSTLGHMKVKMTNHRVEEKDGHFVIERVDVVLFKLQEKALVQTNAHVLSYRFQHVCIQLCIQLHMHMLHMTCLLMHSATQTRKKSKVYKLGALSYGSKCQIEKLRVHDQMEIGWAMRCGFQHLQQMCVRPWVCILMGSPSTLTIQLTQKHPKTQATHDQQNTWRRQNQPCSATQVLQKLFNSIRSKAQDRIMNFILLVCAWFALRPLVVTHIFDRRKYAFNRFSTTEDDGELVPVRPFVSMREPMCLGKDEVVDFM